MTGFAILGWSIWGIGVLVALFFIASSIKERKLGTGAMEALVTLVMTLLIWLIFLVVGLILHNDEDVVEVLDYQQTIYSLEDSQSQISLKYVIRNNNAYYFMTRDDENGYYQRSVSTSNTFINEMDNNEAPSILFYKKIHTKAFTKWFYGETYFEYGKVIINVPKGTVSTEFNIDLK